jgi:hypothetical protein
MLLSLLQVRSQAMDMLGNAASFDREHLGEMMQDALGGTASQVDFATRGAH